MELNESLCTFVETYSTKYNVKSKVEQVAEDALKAEKPYVCWEVIAWKADKLKLIQEFEGNPLEYNETFAWDGMNGIGKPIGKKNKGDKKPTEEEREKIIKKYICGINNDPMFKTKDWGNQHGAFKKAYEKLINEHKIYNIGTVYTITLIYFLSKGKFPIYDKFAHIAAKAIYLNANPKDIYYAEAPGKTEWQKVRNMYNEYCWLLEQIFGTKSINRQTDQALWVYGHSKDKYDGEIIFQKSKNKDKEYRILDFLKDME